MSLLILLALTTTPASGQTELELIDGRVLTGVEVRREPGLYILRLESGEEISFPEELVKTVRLVFEGEELGGDSALPAPPGVIRRSGPQILGGAAPPAGPTGIRSGAPRQLAGQPVRSERPYDQLAVLGQPSTFQKDVVVNDWRPSTDWNMDPEKQNNWAPSEWAEDIVDHSWEPTSVYDADADVMKSSRSTWQKSKIDSSWAPTDGFKK